MAEKKYKAKDIESLAAWIAQGPDRFELLDIVGKAKDVYEDLTNKNPLIRGYELTGIRFLNGLMKNDNVSGADKKLLLEASAYGLGDIKSFLPKLFNNIDEETRNEVFGDINRKSIIEEGTGINFPDAISFGQGLSLSGPATYETIAKYSDADTATKFILNQRKNLFKEILPKAVRNYAFNNSPPVLERGGISLDMDTKEWVNRDTGKRSKNAEDVEHEESSRDFRLRELNEQSRVGFNPEVPEYLGEQTGFMDAPLDLERFYDVTTPRNEYERQQGMPEKSETRDRLDSYFPSEHEGYLVGPEGRYYNEATEKFVKREPTYGPTPELQGYTNDPRLMKILNEAYGSNVQEFKKGGLMDLQQQTQNVAAQGRYGDTMLMHVNPAEVAGLSQVMPLTINPETGQPEAFLPFLLPILGSLGGTALAGTAAGMGLSGAALGAIGSGLGTWAATGDIKKGILGGLAGYGLGQVFGAGKTASDAAKAAASTAGTTAGTGAVIGKEAILGGNLAEVLKQAGTKGINLPGTAIGSAGQSTSQILAGAGSAGAGAGSGLMEGLRAAGTELMKPSAMIPTALGYGGLGMMESQEQFQQAMANLKSNNAEEYNRILAEHPEYVPMLQGNQIQGYAQGGQAKAKKEWKPTAAIQARDIDPYFMAGLQGERGYLQNVNPSSGQIISGKTGYDFGTEMADAPMAEVFNPTQTVGYQSFYNAPREPYVLDPYAPQTFTQPEAPIIPKSVPKTALEEVSESVATLPVPPPEESIVAPFNPASNIVEEGPHTISHDYATGLSREGKEELDTGVPLNYMDILSPSAGAKHSSFEPHPSIPSVINDYNAYLGGQGNMMAGLSREEIESGSYAPSILPSVLAPPSVLAAPPVANIPSVGRGQDRDLVSVAQPSLNIGSIPTELPQEATRVTSDELRNRRRSGGGRYRKAEGGLTNYQEGGITEDMMSDPIVKEAISFMLGQSDNDSIVDKFLGKYGTEAYLALRDMILKQAAQNDAVITEGLIEGEGGGMDDSINGVMGDQEKVAVSQDEFIIPADVVSQLGDGSSNAGADKLYEMMDRVRTAKTGSKNQAPRLANAGGLMPA